MKRIRHILLSTLVGAAPLVCQARQSGDAPTVELRSLLGADTVSGIDLTEPFHTTAKWQFVIRQDPLDKDQLPGPLHFYFLRNDTPRCSDSQFNALVTSVIVHPTPASGGALLTVVADLETLGSGGPRVTIVWAYN